MRGHETNIRPKTSTESSAAHTGKTGLNIIDNRLSSARITSLQRRVDDSNKVTLQIPKLRAATGSSTEVLQRDVALDYNLATTVITNITVNRTHESGIFGDHAGDHSTAHAVFRDMIYNQLMGETLDGARQAIVNLFTWVQTLPGCQDAVTGQLNEQSVINLTTAKETSENSIDAMNHVFANGASTNNNKADAVANAAQDLLNFRNTVPLSAFEFGGTGGGEGTYTNRLWVLEEHMRNLPHGTAANLSALGHGHYDQWPNESINTTIMNAVVRLLDSERIAQHFDGPAPDEVDHDISPGISGNYDADRSNIAEQHMQTIERAYPLLMGHWLTALRRTTLIARLESAMQGN